jgi:hypothetical protein
MPAANVPLYIEQGATFRRSILLTNIKPLTSANITNVAIGIGITSIPVAVGGSGSIDIGDYVSFGTDTKKYKVSTGIADLSLGGTLVITSGLEKAFSASTSIVTYTPMNLTGYTMRAELRQYPKSPTSVCSFTCTIDADPTSGKAVIEIPASTTAQIPTNGTSFSTVAAYNWDLEIEDASSYVIRLFNGAVQVSPETTK